MANGVIKNYDEFKKLDTQEQNFHIYSSLQNIPKIKDLDCKYARKWVEKLITWGGGIAGGAVILYMVNLVLKQ